MLERRQEVIDSVRAQVNNLMADHGLSDMLATQAGDLANEIGGGAVMAVAGTIIQQEAAGLFGSHVLGEPGAARR